MRRWRIPAEYRNYELVLGERPRAPIIESCCILDDLYFIGDDFVGVYVIDTGKGLIMIDCGYDDDYFFDQIKNAFDKYGLKFSDLEYICITHGHFDHYGCAKRLKDLSDAEIWMAKEEYKLACKKSFQVYGTMKEKPDHYIKDGDILHLGATSLKFFITPGHTKESTSIIFDVFDEGRHHKAELFTGCSITRFMNEEMIKEYIDSVDRWMKICEEEGTQVVLCTHPMQINMRERIEVIRNINNKGIPNPFLVSRNGCWRFEQLLLHRGYKALESYRHPSEDAAAED